MKHPLLIQGGLDIHPSFLNETPKYIILQMAREMGFKTKGSSALDKILTQPAYAGLQHVKAFKDYPGGLLPLNVEPLIALYDWNEVQLRLKKPEKQKVVLDDNLPLRGVLKCYCDRPLTGAPSRGRHGGYFYYYKCRESRHLNLSATKAHKQLESILELMSLTKNDLKYIKSNTQRIFDKKLGDDKIILLEKKKELQEEEKKLLSIEEKWITNSINQDTYERWYSTINSNIRTLKGAIEKLVDNREGVQEILYRNLEKLSDLRYIYNQCDTNQKRGLLKAGFDQGLYYENGTYRTPFLMDVLSHRIKLKSWGIKNTRHRYLPI